MIKRAFDITVSLCLVVIFFPLFLMVSVLIVVSMGSPILFQQERVGKDNKIFRLYKFRTMVNAKSPEGADLPDEKRLTKIGVLLRKSSLDELPSIFNVLKGEMSLVGPRPLLVEYLPLYSSQQIRRHETKPGITGWAQINGRNAISWQKRFELDVWYVDNHDFFLDIKILFLTVKKVLKREDINEPGRATMTKFKGDNDS